MTMRADFDRALVQAAVTAGVTFAEEFTFKGYTSTADKIECDFGTERISCTYLIGADGVQSAVAKAANFAPVQKILAGSRMGNQSR